MRKTIIKEYAKLLVKTGLAIHQGQTVIVEANVDQEDFVSLVVDECYKAGAKKVIVRWSSQKVTRLSYKKEKTKSLANPLPFEIEEAKWKAEELPAILWIDSDDPDGNEGINAAKFAEVKAARYKVLGKYREAMENRFQWCIAGAPSPAWAKKIFPELKKNAAMEKLWEAILKTSRADDGNGIVNWAKHDEELKKRCAYLNSLRLKELHYTSSNGTDLRVGLIPGVVFLGGGERVIGGDFEFQPNIPSEECFTSPRRGEAEGIVYSAKPLVYNGQLITDFSIRFHEGKAVEVHAKEGEDALRSILSLDEGSAYLGECALVPFDSPINNTGLLFYNTLYDENACCHLALGQGFYELYPDFEKYSEKELQEFGINHSLSHVDFMIGAKDLKIIGTKENGDQVEIFKDGNWAISF
jgi:aminopeptidase